jgi:Transposase, Mutator family
VHLGESKATSYAAIAAAHRFQPKSHESLPTQQAPSKRPLFATVAGRAHNNCPLCAHSLCRVRGTVSRITDRVLEEMTPWHTRPLERVYAAVFIDALHVKIRDGQVNPRPIYAAIGWMGPEP